MPDGETFPIVFAWDSLAAMLADGVADVVREHWGEIALDKDKVPLNPDWSRYLAWEAAGHWRVFSARRGREIIGYFTWIIEPHIRYQTTIYCTAEVFFIRPDYRQGLFGYRFFKEALKALPKPCKVLINEKLSFQDGRVGKLLERLGMKPIEIVYSRYFE